MKALAITLCLFVWCARIPAQSYSVNWHKIAGGGGISTGGVYQISGTIGQAEAGGPLTAGAYSVTGGYWSQVVAVQTPGAPQLSIRHAEAAVTVSWPVTAGFSLQQNPDVAIPAGWIPSGYSISVLNSTNQVTISPPPAKLFFRLIRP